ncbi:MAG: hypothetical protein MUO52_04725 [Desulfobacterales bacterium]|nr:hypothetical protein [Desulfobacterales bacterium]
MTGNKNDRKTDFFFAATGIGTVPSLNIRGTCHRILEVCPQIPFWPQFVRRSPLEDLSIQFSEGLPLLEKKEGQKALVLSSRAPEPDLVAFYDRFLADDIDRFAISRAYAPGLHEMVSLIQENPERHGPYIKGQMVGPVTFAAGIKDAEGKSLLHNPDLLEALVKGLCIRALWQVRELGRTGKKVIIFLDEPYLSGYGSAFSPLQRDEVIAMIREVLDYLRERTDALIGIHCCGNTDWPMIAETGPDIISFDAFSHMEYLLLYPEEITGFLKRGGNLAWGIVPTFEFTGQESIEGLFSRLQVGLTRLEEWGMDPEQVASQSLLSPACGMGTLDEGAANRVLDLLLGLSRKCQALM